jgi:TPR repeat protein
MSDSRRNSFFGLDSPKSLDLSLSSPEVGFSSSNAIGGKDADDVDGGKGVGGSRLAKKSSDQNVVNGIDNDVGLPKPPSAEESDDEEEESKEIDGRPKKARPSSFFGMQEPLGHVPNPQDGSGNDAGQSTPDPATSRESCPSPTSLAPSQSASNYGGSGDRVNQSNGATRPISVAPTLSGALLDHSHLRPGESAALLSHNKTLELYRQNAKKTNDPELIFELAVFMIEAAKSIGGDDSSGGTGPAGSGSSNSGHISKDEGARDDLVKEAIGLLKKIADRGHPDAQYFLADCYANGIGTVKGKHDLDKAYPLFVLAAKHGHPDAGYRAAMCYEKGWGCRRDAAKAVQFYRKAAAQGHPGAMYRLGTAELNGDLNLKKSAREGVKWLKRSAEAATPEFPHALHELALLHERGVDNVLFADPDYACELLAQAGEMGYAPSAYKLGVNYEYGRMGCPQDAGLSIHMYNIAAQQNHKEACFALTAWYLVGAPGILPQSDTEAYLWAKKAAEQGLAKAEYAVGYFTEMGIGTVRDMGEARSWYRSASEHGDKRANQRLISLGVLQPETNRLLASLGLRRGSEPSSTISQQLQNGPAPDEGVRSGEPPLPQKPVNAREQGMRVAAAAEALRVQQQQREQQQREQQQREQHQLAMAQRAQPLNAPFSAPVDRIGENGGGHPTPMQMRDVQSSQREQAQQQAMARPPQHQALPRPPMHMGHAPAQSRSSFSSQNSAASSQRPPQSWNTSPPQQMSPSSFNPRSPALQKSPMMAGGRPPIPQGIANGSDSHLPNRGSPSPSVTSPTISPQLAQQFQNMHMRGPPPSNSSHASSQESAKRSIVEGTRQPIVGIRPPNSQLGNAQRPPHGAEVAYLQHPRPSPPPGHYAQRPHQHLFTVNGHSSAGQPFRGAPPQRQNSAPPTGPPQNFSSPPLPRPPSGNAYPTYANQPNPERTYRPGIPVVHQPMPRGHYAGSSMSPSEVGSHVSTEADSTVEKRKMGLWAQLKAI